MTAKMESNTLAAAAHAPVVRMSSRGRGAVKALDCMAHANLAHSQAWRPLTRQRHGEGERWRRAWLAEGADAGAEDGGSGVVRKLGCG